MSPKDMRTASQIVGSGHLGTGNFSRGSAMEFAAGCPKHLSSLARFVGVLIKELGGKRTMSAEDLALLANASVMRVRAALHELAAAGHDVGSVT